MLSTPPAARHPFPSNRRWHLHDDRQPATIVAARQPSTGGVDTHKDVHVAVVLDQHGRRLDSCARSRPARSDLTSLRWASGSVPWTAGASKAPAATAPGSLDGLQPPATRPRGVPPDRRSAAIRASPTRSMPRSPPGRVSRHRSQGAPKDSTAITESLRLFGPPAERAEITYPGREPAHALLLTAPADLRSRLDQGTVRARAERCTRLRQPTPHRCIRSRHQIALRSAAHRWLHLSNEIASSTTRSPSSPRRPHRASAPGSASAPTSPPP